MLLLAQSKAKSQPAAPLAISCTVPEAQKTVFLPATPVSTSELRCFCMALAQTWAPLVPVTRTGGTTRLPSLVFSTKTKCFACCGVASGETHATR